MPVPEQAITPAAQLSHLHTNALSSSPTHPLSPQGKQLEVLSSLPEASDRHFVPQEILGHLNDFSLA